MLTRRNFGLAGIGLVAAAAGLRTASSHANEETMSATTETTFEITKTPEEWRKILTPEQFYVLREHGTERAGTSPLDKTYAAGTYECAACDLPLFSSETKFNSGTGWPSFYKPLDNAVGDVGRQGLLHDAHRGALPPLRRPSGPRLPRRASADGPALLHERRRLEVRAQDRQVDRLRGRAAWPLRRQSERSEPACRPACSDWAREIKRDVHALYLAARDPRVPWYAKAVALAVAAYALSPIDLIPDFIPVIGYLDDLIIVPLGHRAGRAADPRRHPRRASRHGEPRRASGRRAAPPLSSSSRSGSALPSSLSAPRCDYFEAHL